MSIIIPDPSRGSDRHAKTALALFHGDSISRSRSLSRAYEEGSSSRDNIDHEIVDKESGDFLFFSLPLSLSFALTCAVLRAAPTHRYACTSRATDRARASKSNASASDTPGSRSFLRSYSHTSSFLARALCLSHSSGLSLSVYLVVSLSLFPSPLDTHSFTVVRSLFQRFSFPISGAGMPASASLSPVSVVPVDEVQPPSSDVIRPPHPPLHSPAPPPLSLLGHKSSDLPASSFRSVRRRSQFVLALRIDAAPIAPV